MTMSPLEILFHISRPIVVLRQVSCRPSTRSSPTAARVKSTRAAPARQSTLNKDPILSCHSLLTSQ
jgi:hypothetical protein